MALSTGSTKRQWLSTYTLTSPLVYFSATRIAFTTCSSSETDNNLFFLKRGNSATFFYLVKFIPGAVLVPISAVNPSFTLKPNRLAAILAGKERTALLYAITASLKSFLEN